IQCNLKKFPTSPWTSSSGKETPIKVVQKPPIKVIKSSNNGVVSAYSDVPKLGVPKSEQRHPTDSDHSADHQWSDSLRSDAIYSQVDKKRNRKNNGNINIVYKQPLNDS